MEKQSDASILRNFLKDIKEQSIVLKHIDFTADTRIEGNFPEVNIIRNLEIQEVRIQGTDIKVMNPSLFEEKEQAFGKGLIIEYIGSYKDILKIENSKNGGKSSFDETEGKVLVDAKFAYEIKLHLGENNVFFKIDDACKRNLLKNFTETTGKLMLFPYLRHVLHSLSLEAGINMPPLKPILIR